MKKLIKKIFHGLGFDIIRYKKRRSIRTDELELHKTATGKYYLPSDAKADHIANTIINNEIYDKEILECAKEYIKPGSVVFDVGANFGQMSILLSHLVGNDGKVYSFEADDFIFRILEKNIKVNDCRNIQPVFGAVHDTIGDTLLFPVQDFERFGTYGSYGIDYSKTKAGREVPTLTIDSLNIPDKISFMKIDVQGGDLYAMMGAVDTIRKNRMPVLFEFEYVLQEEMNLNFQEYVDFVRDIGYKFARVINGSNYLILPA